MSIYFLQFNELGLGCNIQIDHSYLEIFLQKERMVQEGLLIRASNALILRDSCTLVRWTRKQKEPNLGGDAEMGH